MSTIDQLPPRHAGDPPREVDHPDAPAPEAPRGPWRARRRFALRRLAVAAVAVAVLAAAVGGTSLVLQVRSLRSQLADTRARAIAVRVQQIVVSAELADTRRRLGATATNLRRTLDTLDTRNVENEVLSTKLDKTVDQLRGVNGELDTASVEVSLQVLAVELTKQCLVGVQRALEQASVDDFAGAVRSLSAVQSRCERALARTRASSGYAAADLNFPDPFVMRVGGTYYGYATNGPGGSIQVLKGSDIDNMSRTGQALPKLPGWAVSGSTWAPTVLKRGATWVMYYAVKHKASGQNCLSRAVAKSPGGPFVDDTFVPFLCQHDRGGSIDPSPFVDTDGRAWLVWKSEGTGPTEPARIWSVGLSSTGLGFVSQPAALIAADQRWEAGVVEGPSMVRRHGRYYLFYSANDWNSANYAIGYAICTTVKGPCTKPTDRPILRSEGLLLGPGGQEFFTDRSGRTLVAYHAWVDGEIGYPNLRRLYTGILSFRAGAPVISRRTST